MSLEVLSARALNRATLERQLLLQRSTMDVAAAVEHLLGLQSQVPLDPYVGLWSRLEGFEPDRLSRLLSDRVVVRTVLMRGTLHLVTSTDCLELRALFQPVLDRELARHADHGSHLAGIDLEPVLAVARTLLVEPLSPAQLRAALAERFPHLDAAALAYACRNHLALVQVPPRGIWGMSGQVTVTTAEAWLGRSLAGAPSIERLVLRYLAAFGPATAGDAGVWSRLAGLREVVEGLRPQLRTFSDDRGRTVFDLPDAPRPDPDTPAPPRFLPEYDNLLLSHTDRSRFFDRPLRPAGLAKGTVLEDGFVRGIWRIERRRNFPPVLTVEHDDRLSSGALEDISAEAVRLLGFLAPDAQGSDLRLKPTQTAQPGG